MNIDYCNNKMNSNNDFSVCLPVYYLSLIPNKMANTMEVSNSGGLYHLSNV